MIKVEEEFRKNKQIRHLYANDEYTGISSFVQKIGYSFNTWTIFFNQEIYYCSVPNYDNVDWRMKEIWKAQ